jgi:hypothetical protein
MTGVTVIPALLSISVVRTYSSDCPEAWSEDLPEDLLKELELVIVSFLTFFVRDDASALFSTDCIANELPESRSGKEQAPSPMSETTAMKIKLPFLAIFSFMFLVVFLAGMRTFRYHPSHVRLKKPTIENLSCYLMQRSCIMHWLVVTYAVLLH